MHPNRTHASCFALLWCINTGGCDDSETGDVYKAGIAACYWAGNMVHGRGSRRRREEVSALRAGLDLGLRLIDTAEMYADGAAEEVVGEALTGRRDSAFLVSKVYPRMPVVRKPLPPVKRACVD